MTKARSNAVANAAKGDLTVGSGTNTSAILALGADGSSIVADSSTSTGLRYQAVQTRNCVYNSQMEVWQRGTSFTAQGYVADRWYFSPNGASGRTVTRQAGTGQFQYVMRVARDSGNTNTTGTTLGQSFEIADSTPYAGKTVTVSFYARAGANYSGASSNLSCFIFSGTSSTETNRITTAYPSGGTTVASLTSVLTTTLQRFQFTFTFGAGVTQFCIDFEGGASGTAGAADYYEVTGVQLEVGSIATNYVRQGATIQGELAACQRYYYRLVSGSTYGVFNQYGIASSSTNIVSGLALPVTMRTNPSGTIDFSNLRAIAQQIGVYNAISAVTIDTLATTPNYLGLNLTTTGLTTSAISGFSANNSTAAYIGASAEL